MKPFSPQALCLLLPICFLLTQCKKEEDNGPYEPVQLCSNLTHNVDTIHLLIEGTWEWIENKNFDRRTGTYVYQTPKTEGYSRLVKIKGGKATFYKNFLLENSFDYKILKESDITIYPEDTRPVIAFYNTNTGQRESYDRIKICENFMVLLNSYWSDAVGDDIWRKL